MWMKNLKVGDIIGKDITTKCMKNLKVSGRGQRMSGAIPPLPNTPSWCDIQLKHRGSFTFTFYYS
jgi:hypothetical protein